MHDVLRSIAKRAEERNEGNEIWKSKRKMEPDGCLDVDARIPYLKRKRRYKEKMRESTAQAHS